MGKMRFAILFFGLYLMTSVFSESAVSNSNEKLTAINSDWIAMAKWTSPAENKKLLPTRHRRSTSSPFSHGDGVISTIAMHILSFYPTYNREAANVLYLGANEKKFVKVEVFIKQIVSHAYTYDSMYIRMRRDHASRIIDFILLELDGTDEMIQWLNALFEVMNEHNHLATADDRQQLGRAVKRVAHLFELKQNGLKELARIANNLTEPIREPIADKEAAFLKLPDNGEQIGDLATTYQLYLTEIDTANNTDDQEFTKNFLFDVYKANDMKKILHFITFDVNDHDHICFWLSALFELMKNDKGNKLASFDGLYFVQTVRRMSKLVQSKWNRHKCYIDFFKVRRSFLSVMDDFIGHWAQLIHCGKIRDAGNLAKIHPAAFVYVVKQLIPMAIGLHHSGNENNMHFFERCSNTIRFINNLPLSTVVDALFSLIETLNFEVKPHYIPMYQRIKLTDRTNEMLTKFRKNHHLLPIHYQHNLAKLINDIPPQIQRIAWSPYIFIYKIDNKNNRTRKLMTSSSSNWNTRFESDKTRKSSQWILEPINKPNQYRIKNMESGEYLYANDDSTLRGFPNKRSVFTYKLDENESDINKNSIGDRMIWILTPLLDTKSERFLIMNLHWKEYLDIHESLVLNAVYTWKDKFKPLDSYNWIISDGRDVEKHQLHLVCYFNSKAAQIKGAGRFTVDNIDPSLCTHVIYSEARIDKANLTMTIGNEEIDIIDKGYEKIVSLKNYNPQLKVMIALGGWELDVEQQARLHSDPENIKTFVNSVDNFLSRHGFDGIHFDFEPILIFRHEKEGVKPLLNALNDVLKSKNYLLSVAINSLDDKPMKGYVSRLNEKLDFIIVNTFKYHGNWEDRVNHHAPLYSREAREESMAASVDKLIKEGVLPNKIVVGIPFFGTVWVFESNSTNPNNNPIPGSKPGKLLESIKEDGIMAYYEICDATQNDDWQVFQDPDLLMGPYAVSPIEPNKNRTWVGYDDPDMARVKANYIISKGLGGAHVWDLSQDDFLNTCSGGINPMLTAIADSFGN